MDRQIAHRALLRRAPDPANALPPLRRALIAPGMDHAIVMPETPTDADRDAVLAVLAAYNDGHVSPPRRQPLALLLKDADGGTIGGLWGRSSYDWLFVEYLAVPDHLRGREVGTALMRQAEQVARDRGCAGIWLDTFAFQARGFYEKLGFTLFGTIADHPVGSARFFLSKRLDA
jgi:GNAT superfamily N-acetyltransferase